MNKNKLSKDNVALFYKYLCDYEYEYKNAYGKFNIEDDAFVKYCKDNGIQPKGNKNMRNVKGDIHGGYFWFTSHQIKTQNNENDKAHHLLRHIRNAFAHGLVTNDKKYFHFKDYHMSRKKTLEPTMGGYIKKDLFWSFLDVLIKTKK